MPDVQSSPVPAVSPAAPPSPAPTSAPAGRVLTPAQVGAWKRRITAALDATKDAVDKGKTNVARFKGEYLNTTPSDDTCLVPSDFYYLVTKTPQLFYRLPDVVAEPDMPGLEDAAIVFRAALNKKLGPKGVNVLPKVKQVIFDVLCPTGFGALVVGYQTVIGEPPTIPVQVGEEPDPDAPPPPIMGGILGLSAPMPMRPVFADAPNIVAKWFFISHVRPGDLIVPPDFVGTDFDEAPYLGIRFEEAIPDGEDEGGDQKDDDRRLSPLPGSAQAARRKTRKGAEVWYRAHLFDADVQHPDKIRMFKLYDDETDQMPIQVRDHPHQRYKTPAGELKEGMKGYPIKPVVLRYVSDTWMVPSDATMARNTADELSKGRTQMLRSRDRNMPQWGFDATRVDKDMQAKIERNEIQGGIPFNGPVQDATAPIQKGTAPKETYTFEDYAERTLDRIWRLPPNSRGELDAKSRTATEQQIAASSSQEAHQEDRSVILSWYVDKVVTAFASLMQLYATETEYVELVGSDAQRLKSIPPEIAQAAKQAGQDAKVLVPWNNDLIKGPFSFKARPNSQLYVDAAQEAKRKMDTYQFFANSPTVNKAELERQILLDMGYDTSRVCQAPPPKEAQPPGVSLSVKGDDFNPLMPQAPILLDALSKLGVPIDLEALQAAMAVAQQVPPETGDDAEHGAVPANPETEHGGAVAQAEPLSKHAASETGNMQGSGGMAPMGPGGH